MMYRVRKSRKQKGATLLVGLVMLVVLTLLVVFAIRSGNTNLKIAGNVQSQVEASAATQQVIEQVIEQIKVTEDPSLIAAQTVDVVIGNVTYNVVVTDISKCVVEVPILNSALNPANANDVACFESPDGDGAFNPNGTLTSKPSACKSQQWEIEAGVTDSTTGTKVSQVQGISIRVPAVVQCL